MNHRLRYGRFTSSQNFRAVIPGRRTEYINEKRWERKLKRPLSKEVFSRPMSWGHFCEKHAFAKLDISYALKSQTTIVHPDYDFWSGSADLIMKDAVGDIKCPELKAFCQLMDCGDDPKKLMKFKYGEYFWQVVSNACIHNKKYGELVIYVPYFNDLVKLQEAAETDEDQYQWIARADVEELQYLHKDGGYKDLNIIRFDTDPYKEEMTDAIVEAEKELNA